MENSNNLSATCDNLVWGISWTLAFPTLVPKLIFVPDHDIVWQKLALRVIWKNEVRDSSHTVGRSHMVNVPSDMYTNHWCNSLGYGEITEDTILSVLGLVRSYGDLPRNPCLIDLGSGNGRVLLAASLACPLSNSTGIEIVQKLHNEAIANFSHWEIFDFNCTHSSDQPRFEWVCADFTKHIDWISNADLIFIHATVFEADLMVELSALCEKCRRNTYFCLVSKMLESNEIETISEMQCELSWGKGNIFIQKRL
jgi:Histone methylation protein DOT1